MVENSPNVGTSRGPAGRLLGVCSWSLRPRGATDLVAAIQAAGLMAVQLALDPLRNGAMDPGQVADALAAAAIAVPSGMLAFPGEDYLTLESIRRTGGVVPDAEWPHNLAAAREAAAIAARLGVPLVSFHAGFIPPRARDPRRAVVLDRIRAVAEPFLGHGIVVALETGQEHAITLLDALETLGEPRIGVNFDPANMILYGTGDPVHALDQVAPRVRQLHLKDALPAATPGQWGLEVPAGTGAVDWSAFFALVGARLPGVPLMIERESGDDRIDDVRRAAALAARHLELRA